MVVEHSRSLVMLLAVFRALFIFSNHSGFKWRHCGRRGFVGDCRAHQLYHHMTQESIQTDSLFTRLDMRHTRRFSKLSPMLPTPWRTGESSMHLQLVVVNALWYGKLKLSYRYRAMLKWISARKRVIVRLLVCYLLLEEDFRSNGTSNNWQSIGPPQMMTLYLSVMNLVSLVDL